MRDFFLNENHIWKDQESKDKFLSKERRTSNEFWINLLGFLGLYSKYKNDNRLIQYFKQSTARLDKVTDSDNDLMVILKIVEGKKVIPDMVLTKLTKLLAKIKQGSLTSLDENLLRDEIIKRIKISSVNPYPPIATPLRDFIKGNKTLSDMLPDLYSAAMQYKRGHEFRVLYKRLSGITDGSTAAPADGAQGTQQATDTTTPVSPIKSVLTGEPKPEPVAIKTSVIPSAPEPVAKALTWTDILSYIGVSPSDFNIKSYLALCYLYNSSSRMEFLGRASQIGVSLRSSEAYRYFSVENIVDFLYNDIPAYVTKEFPQFNTLHKPLLGSAMDSVKSEFFKDFLLYRSDVFFIRWAYDFINFPDIKMAQYSTFIEHLASFLELGSKSLKALGIEDKWIEKAFDNAREVFVEAFKADPSGIINKYRQAYSVNKMELLDNLFDKKFPIFKNLTDSAVEYLDKDQFIPLVVHDSTPQKELAKRFIQLSSRDCAAYLWADGILTFEDKVGDGLTFDMLNKQFIGYTPAAWAKFYNDSLKENNLGFKEFIEKYKLKYSDFLSEVTKDSDLAKKYILFSFYMYERFRLDMGYLIEDIVTSNISFEIEWLGSTVSDNRFLGYDCLNYFLKQGNTQGFNELLDKIIVWGQKASSMYRVGVYSLAGSSGLKSIFRRLSPSSSEYKKLIESLTVIHEGKLSDEVVSEFSIPLEFVAENIEYFTKMNALPQYWYYEWGRLFKLFSESVIDLSKYEKTKVLLDKVFGGEGYNSIKDHYKLNGPTMSSYKDALLKYFKRVIEADSETYGKKYILDDLEYMVSKDVLTKEEAKKEFESYFDEITKSVVFNLIDKYKTNEELENSFILDYMGGSDDIREYMLKSPENDRALRSIRMGQGYHRSKRDVIQSIATYLDKNSLWFGKLYSEYGIDTLVEHFKDLDVLWGNVASGKSVFNKSSSLEFIMLDLLSDKDKIKDLDKFFGAFPEHITKSLIAVLREQLLVAPLLNDLYLNDNPLKPATKLTPDRIKTLLKYNNFEFTGVLGKKKKNETWASYFERVNDMLRDDNLIPKINLEKIDETKEDLEKKTVEYSKYYNGKHGSSAVEFLESYTVNMKYPWYDKFKERFGENNLIPAFHGSGMTASNFILRFGFTIIPASDSSAVGRMLDIRDMFLVKPKSEGDAIEDSNDYISYLENGYYPVYSHVSRGNDKMYPTSDYHTRRISTVGGIYISNVIEKVAQYLGDDGYARREGTVGVIYECEVNLGEKGLHHHVAGTGGDSIRSPEWAVCWPQAQINIVKAHKVRFTNKGYVNSLKKKYPNVLKENKYFKRFADFLQEQEMVKSKNVITFVFHQGLIPNDKEIMTWEDFEKRVIKNSSKMYVDSNQYGIGVVFHTDKELSGVIRVPFTDEFMLEDPDGLYSQFINLIDECKG